VFSLEEPNQLSVHSDQQEQLFMAVSQAAVTGADGPKTLRLQGTLQGHLVLILVDSGSSHTFVSQQLATSSLSGVQPLQTNVQVKVAHGDILLCDNFIPQALWSVDGYQFSTDMRVLPLRHFDVILGMDWLEAHSPMKVHWKSKWLSVPSQNSTAILQGIIPQVPEEVIIHLCSLLAAGTSLSVSFIHEVEAIIQEFSHVFEPLSSLPPKRSCDHAIPLVPGAKAVSIRPYRYPPALKDEFERQVADMLAKEIIQPSQRSFSSPILLVKKKSGTWRFCIGYRYLNALTVKSKFPIPIFDELMDELAKVSWFSTLDLDSGYHQIRMKQDDEYKAAFQTHFGHFEFMVVAFGLCGAPGPFQGATIPRQIL